MTTDYTSAYQGFYQANIIFCDQEAIFDFFQGQTEKNSEKPPETTGVFMIAEWAYA